MTDQEVKLTGIADRKAELAGAPDADSCQAQQTQGPVAPGVQGCGNAPRQAGRVFSPAQRHLKKAYLEITNCCNLACSFCHQTTREKHFMTEAEFDALTDALKGKVTTLYFHLMGEPLLHPLLPRFIEKAAEKGFDAMITTNGTLLGRRGEELLATPLKKVSISLHAPEANGAFASPEYLDGCIAFAKAAPQKGIFTVLRLWNEGGLDKGNGDILARLEEAFPPPWEMTRSGMRIADRVFIERAKKFDWPDAGLPEISGEHFCYGLRDQIGILCDGTAVPCCLDAEGVMALGNLHEMPLEAILETPRARAIYDGFTAHRAVEELCRKCGYAALTQQYRKK